jgi:hypothetical protein
MKKRFERAKEWCKSNSGALITAGITVAGIASLVVAVKKEQQRQVVVQQELTDAAARGATILPSYYGGYWIIEPQPAQ